MGRDTRKDYSAEAETLFRDFAARHSFLIEKTEPAPIELLMTVPQQQGLSFELTLGLQNADELNIGFGQFWSYFFPFEEERSLVERALDGIATGSCRLAIHKQFNRVVRRNMELRTAGRWEVIYPTGSLLRIPFIGTAVSHLYNDAAAASS